MLTTVNVGGQRYKVVTTSCEIMKDGVLRLITKEIPEGWRLVEPDEKILRGDLIAYTTNAATGLFNSISVYDNPIAYWSTPQGMPIKENDVYKSVCVASDLYRLIRKKDVVKQTEPVKMSEGDKLFSFFFPDMKMSNPKTLPPPPRVLGRSWDSIADE